MRRFGQFGTWHAERLQVLLAKVLEYYQVIYNVWVEELAENIGCSVYFLVLGMARLSLDWVLFGTLLSGHEIFATTRPTLEKLPTSPALQSDSYPAG